MVVLNLSLLSSSSSSNPAVRSILRSLSVDVQSKEGAPKGGVGGEENDPTLSGMGVGGNKGKVDQTEGSEDTCSVSVELDGPRRSADDVDRTVVERGGEGGRPARNASPFGSSSPAIPFSGELNGPERRIVSPLA